MTLKEEIQLATDKVENSTKEHELKIAKLETEIKKYTNWAWSFVIGGLVIGVFGLIAYLFGDNQNFNLNLIGDFYGGTVASIWSLAGLFFIYVAFLGQKQQLLNQQLEIMHSQLEVKYTRLELAGQKQEMREQNKTLRQQRFENTFFQLLTLFSSIVNSLDLRKRSSKTEVISTGRDCFEIFYKRLQGILDNNTHSISGFTIPTSTVQQAIEAFGNFYDSNKSDMSHYFRTLYHIIKFVDESIIENKKQYTSIVRAQLSSYEQVMLFYNCLHGNGKEKFKPLIEKYSIFKNLDTLLIFNQDHLNEYNDGAYR